MNGALIEQFDLLAASVGGVAKLRELILSLAVRGKLVPQDLNDEPAGELLKKVRAEKDRMIKEGKVKRAKSLPDIGEDEKPFEVPKGWEWVRLGQIASRVQYGYTASADHSISTPKMLRITDIQDDKVNWESVPGVQTNGQDLSAYFLEVGDLLIARTGGTIGKSFLVETAPVNSVFASYLIRVSPHNVLRPNYAKVFASSPAYWVQLLAKSMGTGQPNVNGASLSQLMVPLPPLAEQSRIVAKVEELMALCDRLEAEQAHAERVHGHWVEAALDQLAESADADDFRRNWQHLASHFDTLFATPESITALESTLLQLAVRGKLVPQDPNDEPASELLKQIRAEKDRLIAEGKIKRDKPVPPTADEKIPCDLPRGWERVTIPQLCQIGGGATPSKNISRYWDGNIPWVSPKDMKVALIADALDHVSKAALEETRLPLVPTDSLLIVVRGMILAHSFPVGITQTEVTINQDMKSLTPYLAALSNYLALAMRGFKQDILALVDRSTHGTCKLESEKLFSYRFAVPPLAEQTRIVAQVEKLLALTADLKARLTAAQTKQAHLAEALIADVC